MGQKNPKAFISKAYDLTPEERLVFEENNKVVCKDIFKNGDNEIGLDKKEYLEIAKDLLNNIGYASQTISRSNNISELSKEELKAVIENDGMTEFMMKQARELLRKREKEEVEEK